MTTSTIHIDPDRARSAAISAFTLVEILMGLGLSTMLLAGILSAFLMMGRSGINVAHYSMSESELRRGIEEFSQDVRMANAIKWNSATSVTLTVPDNYTTTQNKVTYAWDNSTSGATAQCFYRKAGDAASAEPKTTLVRSVINLSFSRYNRLNGAAPTDAATKRLQITIGVSRTRSTLVAATTRMVTASYTLRNKVIN